MPTVSDNKCFKILKTIIWIKLLKYFSIRTNDTISSSFVQLSGFQNPACSLCINMHVTQWVGSHQKYNLCRTLSPASITALSVHLSVCTCVSLSMVVRALSVSPIHLWLMIICTYNDGVYLYVLHLYNLISTLYFCKEAIFVV